MIKWGCYENILAALFNILYLTRFPKTYILGFMKAYVLFSNIGKDTRALSVC